VEPVTKNGSERDVLEGACQGGAGDEAINTTTEKKLQRLLAIFLQQHLPGDLLVITVGRGKFRAPVDHFLHGDFSLGRRPMQAGLPVEVDPDVDVGPLKKLEIKNG